MQVNHTPGGQLLNFFKELMVPYWTLIHFAKCIFTERHQFRTIYKQMQLNLLHLSLYDLLTKNPHVRIYCQIQQLFLTDAYISVH